jgi:hypothetical protein
MKVRIELRVVGEVDVPECLLADERGYNSLHYHKRAKDFVDQAARDMAFGQPPAHITVWRKWLPEEAGRLRLDREEGL